MAVDNKYIVVAAIGFVAGIFLYSFVEFGVAFPAFFVWLGAVLFLYTRIHRHKIPSLEYERRQPIPLLRLAAVFVFAVGLGMWRYDVAELKSTKTGLEGYANQAVTLEGIIADEPDVREATTRLILRVESPDVNAKILLTVPHEPRFLYGDRVAVEGKLKRPENFTDEKTLREVDYVSHLDKDGIVYEMFQPKIILQKSGEGNVIVEKLFTFKKAFIENVSTLLPEPHASLLGGLIVGAKQSLGKKLLDDFRAVGVIHIVVLSGYNITIIALFIERLLSHLRKNTRLIFAATAMVLFAVMVGASATVIRATVMALLVLLARGTGRIYQVTRALLLAGVIMLLHNPKILVFDTSFQLSFLATIGLIYVSPLVESRMQWVTARWHFRDVIVATISTQIFVLPFLLYKTGTLSLVSLPANLLILTAIPATMLFGFLAGLAGFLSGALAAPFAFLSYALLAYELAVVEWFSKLPFSAVTIQHFPFWLVVFLYGIYATLLVMWRKSQSMASFKESLLS